MGWATKGSCLGYPGMECKLGCMPARVGTPRGIPQIYFVYHSCAECPNSHQIEQTKNFVESKSHRGTQFFEL